MPLPHVFSTANPFTFAMSTIYGEGRPWNRNGVMKDLSGLRNDVRWSDCYDLTVAFANLGCIRRHGLTARALRAKRPTNFSAPIIQTPILAHTSTVQQHKQYSLCAPFALPCHRHRHRHLLSANLPEPNIVTHPPPLNYLQCRSEPIPVKR
jgi:hypothetical protein